MNAHIKSLRSTPLSSSSISAADDDASQPRVAIPSAAPSVLLAIFDLSRVGIAADVHRIAGRLGLSVAQVRHALVHLDGRGLADAQRVRLAMPGLALATMLDARRSEARPALSPARRGRVAA